MPEVREYFPEIDALDIVALHARREAILSPIGQNYQLLPDESLAELLAITRALRKKAAAPGGKKKSLASKEKPSLESLA